MKRLAELRNEKHLTQAGLALELDISQYMISAYETGKHEPSIDMLIRIANFFGISIDYLVGNSDVRYRAEMFTENNATKLEKRLLLQFRQLTNEQQEIAIGSIYALKNYSK